MRTVLIEILAADKNKTQLTPSANRVLHPYNCTCPRCVKKVDVDSFSTHKGFRARKNERMYPLKRVKGPAKLKEYELDMEYFTGSSDRELFGY